MTVPLSLPSRVTEIRSPVTVTASVWNLVLLKPSVRVLRRTDRGADGVGGAQPAARRATSAAGRARLCRRKSRTAPCRKGWVAFWERPR
ncbi:hypothetical protein GCM10010238_60220 [Streptomyces griseoviridis]|uniref:Uncharacterized protein n=1 Tax=Streptomyces griseoviridis TaxID=45398 RepID=A0A918LKM5_STRGD|nr:hypothetical protein GCM10010238_60220 [Streptomyces niveoruber]